MLYISTKSLLSYLITKHIASLSSCKWLCQTPRHAQVPASLHAAWEHRNQDHGMLCSPAALSRNSAPEVFGGSGSSPGSCGADTSLPGQEPGCLLRGTLVSPKIDNRKPGTWLPSKAPQLFLSRWAVEPPHALPPRRLAQGPHFSSSHLCATHLQLAPGLSSKYIEEATSPKPCPALQTQPHSK